MRTKDFICVNGWNYELSVLMRWCLKNNINYDSDHKISNASKYEDEISEVWLIFDTEEDYMLYRMTFG